jgi:F420H(2)-dependent quinone reductase
MSEELPYLPSPRDWVREQVEDYERSGGTEANTFRDTGLPIFILRTIGVSTGALRKIPLMTVEHGGEYAIVGSSGGAPVDPLWVANLRANPGRVQIQDGPEPFDVSIRQVEGDEKAVWWERAVAAFPPYADYQAKTERAIPVFIATRK